MSKYDAPQGPPPNYPQQHYDAGPVDQRGANADFYQGQQPYGGQQQYPPQQGYYPQQPPQVYQQYPPGQQPMQYGAPQQGYPPPGMYQDRGRSGGGGAGCCAGIFAGLAACCCLDMLF